MGFLGLIPSIRVFSDPSGSPQADREEHEDDGPGNEVPSSPEDLPAPFLNIDTQRSAESLKVTNSRHSRTPSAEQQQSPVNNSNEASPVSYTAEERSGMDPLSHLILKRVGTSQSLKSSHQSVKSHQSPAGPTAIPVTNQNSPGLEGVTAATSGATSLPISSTSTATNNNNNNASSKASTTSENANRFLGTMDNSNNNANNINSTNSSNNDDFPPRKSPHQHNSKGGFFSKLLKNSSGRPTLQDEKDNVTTDKREEGWKADVFGYVPNYPTPPKYIHVRAHRMQKREMNRVFLAQQLTPPENSRGSAIWCAKFSHDGKYLATAGEDTVIRVWQVLSVPGDRENNNNDTNNDNNNNDEGGSEDETRKRVYAPVFKHKPVREYYGHTGDVLDISWSKNNFLLSSSMDKTVRLWHIERTDCLCSFLHADFVTAIRFHPKDDRFFLSGSLDCKLRLWSIPDKEVAFSKEVPDLITAVAFTPQGLTCVVGCFGGQCLFYETDGLNFQSQMHVRSSRGRNSKGSKITGIETITLPKEVLYKNRASFDSDKKILISTNDSRIRIYNLYDKTMEAKFKGHENEQSQIQATFSDNGMYIISGSEDDRTYIWKTQTANSSNSNNNNSNPDHGKKKDIQEYEYFHSNKSMVTVAMFAPTLTKKTLADSEDPIYDLCDPPPVKLTPRDEEPDEDTIGSSTTTSNNNNSHTILRTNSQKSSHENGNIIITADREGIIKIFRQDCAAEPRKNYMDMSGTSAARRRISSGLSPTHSWRESWSLHRSRSARTNSPSRFPRLGSSERVPSSLAESTRGRSRLTSPSPSFSNLSQFTKTNGSKSPEGRNTTKGNNEDIRCKSCNGIEFLARKVDGVVRLVCTSCGEAYH